MTPVNKGHWHDFINVILDDEYGLLDLDNSPTNIVDLGANIGIFSLWARHCFPDAVIQAYEPNTALKPYLDANLEGLRIELYQSAVAARDSKAKLTLSHDNRCSKLDLGTDGDIQVESISKVIARAGGKVDLLKIDIEGGEWELFLNEEMNYLKHVQRIVCEYHETHSYSMENLIEAAIRLGFEVEQIFPNRGFGIAWLRRSMNERQSDLV